MHFLKIWLPKVMFFFIVLICNTYILFILFSFSHSLCLMETGFALQLSICDHNPLKKT